MRTVRTIPPLGRSYARRGLYEGVQRALRNFNWSPVRHQVVVGVSGGRDSVCLLHLLLNLGCKVYVAHVNHQLRGRESDRDERFVRELCHQWKVPLSVLRVNVAAKAKRHRLSIEEAARIARYRFFAQVARRRNIHDVAVAHHQKDQAETVLMRILMGCDRSRLRGMEPSRPMPCLNWSGVRAAVPFELRLVRPMLDAPVEWVELYARQNRLKFYEDSSNKKTSHPRNWIRHKLLPMVEKGMNRNVIRSLARLAAC